MIYQTTRHATLEDVKYDAPDTPATVLLIVVGGKAALMCSDAETFTKGWAGWAPGAISILSEYWKYG